MSVSIKEARARAEAEAAKARMTATIDELKARLAPKTLATQAVQAAKDKSIVVADGTVNAVKEKPLVAAGIATGTALFFARKPIWSALGRVFGKTRKKSHASREHAHESED